MSSDLFYRFDVTTPRAWARHAFKYIKEHSMIDAMTPLEAQVIARAARAYERALLSRANRAPADAVRLRAEAQRLGAAIDKLERHHALEAT